jgi:hypothetical protein
MQYQITVTASSLDLGTFTASDEEGAYLAMLADAGSSIDDPSAPTMDDLKIVALPSAAEMARAAFKAANDAHQAHRTEETEEAMEQAMRAMVSAEHEEELAAEAELLANR